MHTTNREEPPRNQKTITPRCAYNTLQKQQATTHHPADTTKGDTTKVRGYKMLASTIQISNNNPTLRHRARIHALEHEAGFS